MSVKRDAQVDADRKQELEALVVEMRKQTDPPAEETVKRILELGELDEVNGLFDKLIRTSDTIPNEWPSDVKAYFEQSARLPDWMDKDKVLLGERIYSDYGPECMLVLLFKSLPEGYAHWHVAETLAITGRMRDPHHELGALTRRILETLQFIINVMTPGGITSPAGEGMRSAQKVRLIHASIRGFIKKSPKWGDDWPEPINQAELLMTMLSFSVVVVEGLEKFGIELTPEESEAILHMWKVVGFVMGLREEYLPRNVQEGKFIWHTLLELHRRHTDAGVELTQALIDYGKSIMPSKFFNFLPKLLVRLYVDRTLCKLLHVRPVWNPIGWLMLGLFNVYLWIIQRLGRRWLWVETSLRKFNLVLLQQLLLMWNDHKQMHFYIPPSLSADWGVKPTQGTST